VYSTFREVHQKIPLIIILQQISDTCSTVHVTNSVTKLCTVCSQASIAYSSPPMKGRLPLCFDSVRGSHQFR
jgi:hypothetical protein